MRLDKEQQEKAHAEAEQRVRDQKAKDLDLAMRVAGSSPAPGQELTADAEQLKNAAAEMLDSGTDASFVAGYVQRKLERTRSQQRGGGRGE